MDNVQIYPPGASQTACYAASAIQLGSWIIGDPGPNYGAQGLLQSIKSSNALSDGGRFGFRYAPVRQMALPLQINQVGTTTPQQAVKIWEGRLRNAVTPGAMISIQPEGAATSEAVYFDVLDGRWEPDYNIYENRAGVRRGTLFVDTQPFGYWPTEILLASAASVGYLGQLAVNGAASVIGDVPPLAHVIIAPTVSSYYAPTFSFGIWSPDTIGVSFGARPSFQPWWPAASFNSATYGGVVPAMAPSLIGDKYAPASQALQYLGTSQNPNGVVWNFIAWNAIPSALEPAYRGRFRAFALIKNAPSQLNAFQYIVDAERYAGAGSSFSAMASSNTLATGYSVTPSIAGPGGLVSPSPGYPMLDMGELTLPPNASGVQGPVRLRLWTAFATNAAAALPSFLTTTFAGLYLLPVDGAAGIQTRGLFSPSLGQSAAGLAPGSQAAIEFNTNYVDSISIVSGFGAGPQPVLADARSNYRGQALRIGASTSQLLFVTGDRLANAGGVGTSSNYATAQANLEYAQVSVSYRPAFQFLYGL